MMSVLLDRLNSLLPKPLVFALYGSLGCLLAALVVGEPLWWCLAPSPPPPPKPVVIKKQSPAPSGPIRHVVRRGDNLKSLAVQYYGRSEKWVEIYEVNRRSIGPDGELAEGQVLVIPEGDR